MRTLRGPLTVLVLSFVMLFAALGTARAQSLDSALQGFAADSFGDTEKALGAVASSSSPQALPIVEALRDGRLLSWSDDHTLRLWREDAGQFTSLAWWTGQILLCQPSSAQRMVTVVTTDQQFAFRVLHLELDESHD